MPHINLVRALKEQHDVKSEMKAVIRARALAMKAYDSELSAQAISDRLGVKARIVRAWLKEPSEVVQ